MPHCSLIDQLCTVVLLLLLPGHAAARSCCCQLMLSAAAHLVHVLSIDVEHDAVPVGCVYGILAA
jgi:hypothetical protein